MRGVKAGLICMIVVALSACSSAGVQRSEEQLAKSSQINTDLGQAYLRKHDSERALTKLLKALEQDPTNAKAHFVIAVVYETLARPDLAGDHYAKAVELDPQNSYARNAYGVYLCRKEEVDGGLKQFEAAVSNPLYPRPEEALAHAGQCVRARDSELAERYLRSALRKNPEFPPALIQMAGISFDKGNALSARGYLQRYLAVAKHTPQTLWLGIQIERELGDRDAVASYSLLLKKQFPDSEEALRLQASKH